MNFWNLLPALPWHYGAWTPWLLAVACWFFVFLVVLCIFLSPRSNRAETARFLAFVLVVRLLLVFWDPTTAPTASDPVAEWRHRSREAEQVMETLKTDREMLQERLAQADDRHRRILAAEIDEIDDQIVGVERETERMEGVVVGLESQSRRERRKEMVSGLLAAEKREEAIRKGLEAGKQPPRRTLHSVRHRERHFPPNDRQRWELEAPGREHKRRS